MLVGKPVNALQFHQTPFPYHQIGAQNISDLKGRPNDDPCQSDPCAFVSIRGY